MLPTEFHDIYVFNLRGNTRTSGEQAKKEGGQTFGPGSRNTIAITLLVRRPDAVPEHGAQIHYRDIGDYLSADEKLRIVGEATVPLMPWKTIAPNAEADWINQRDSLFDDLLPLVGEPGALFETAPNGVKTNRDAWVFNSSSPALTENVERMVEFYNQQLESFVAPPSSSKKTLAALASDHVEKDPTRYSWNLSDFERMANGLRNELRSDMLRPSLYRPFMKQHLAFDSSLARTVGRLPALFPAGAVNVGIGFVAPGSKSPFGVLATDVIPSMHLIGSDITGLLARWRYATTGSESQSLFAAADAGRVSNLNSATVQRFREALGLDITDDDIFRYVYGVLHSSQFRERFEFSLMKQAPRVPVVSSRSDFDTFAVAGGALLDLHLCYETVEPYPLSEDWSPSADPDTDPKLLLVGPKKMCHPKITDPETGRKVADKTRLIYNEYLTLSGIPLEAYDYVIGTRSGLDWIIDRWYVKTDKASGIVNDVNRWGLERGEPRYIIDLIKRVVTVSTRTVEIVRGLPELSF